MTNVTPNGVSNEPQVLSITFDKVAYNPGDTITATVDYVAGTPIGALYAQPMMVQIVDQDLKFGNSYNVAFEANQSANYYVATSAASADLAISINDNSPRTWTKVSDTGSTAVFTTTA